MPTPLRISILAFLFLLTFCAPAPTATPPPTATLKPTAQPTATETAAPATATPPPTATLTPTAQPTATETVASAIATATNTAVPPTKTPDATPTPTEIPRPAPVVVARYGNEKDILNFSYPEQGGVPYTMHVFTDERSFLINSGQFGVRGFTYITFPNGQESYKSWRDGKSSGGTGEFTSGYFLPVTEARLVNQAKGEFVIRSKLVNAAGIPVILEYTLADNDVWIHIPPSDKRRGEAFGQLLGSSAR